MRRVSTVSSLVAAAALVLAGCGDGGGGSGATAGGSDESGDESVCESSDGDGPRIGVAYDVGGRGDLSFNDAAISGVEQAVEELDATCREVEAAAGENDTDREERLRILADAGFDPIIGVGFIYSAAAATVSQEYPETSFAIVDGFTTFITGEPVEIPNVADLNFAEEQGSFLVGVAAAMKTEKDNVGFIGGTNTPLINKFEAGYVAGVKAVDPKIKIQTQYLSQEDPVKGFENPGDGRTVAEGMYEDSDVIYHAAGKSGLGLFEAVVRAGEGNWAIGVDSDQYLTADEEQKPYILTSMLKRIDVAVLEYVQAYADGEPPSGVALYDLAVDGVGYSTSNEEAMEGLTGEIDDYAQRIKAGDIKVPTEP